MMMMKGEQIIDVHEGFSYLLTQKDALHNQIWEKQHMHDNGVKILSHKNQNIE